MKKFSYADRYTYRQLRKTHLLQRKWWMGLEAGDKLRRRYRITSFLGYRAKYARHLVNSPNFTYNTYGEVRRLEPKAATRG
jgi:hypothetical protein